MRFYCAYLWVRHYPTGLEHLAVFPASGRRSTRRAIGAGFGWRVSPVRKMSGVYSATTATARYRLQRGIARRCSERLAVPLLARRRFSSRPAGCCLCQLRRGGLFITQNEINMTAARFGIVSGHYVGAGGLGMLGGPYRECLGTIEIQNDKTRRPASYPQVPALSIGPEAGNVHKCRAIVLPAVQRWRLAGFVIPSTGRQSGSAPSPKKCSTSRYGCAK